MDSKERLNQLGEQWFDAKKRGLKNEQMNIQSEVFLLIVQLFPKRLNAISDFFLSNWENFSPEKGDLYSFCSMRLYYRDRIKLPRILTNGVGICSIQRQSSE